MSNIFGRCGQLICLLLLIQSCQSITFIERPHAKIPKPGFKKQPFRFALVLGGGGARGLAHAGVLEELERANLRPDLIVGCSAGALVGSLYAARPDAKHLKELLISRTRKDFLRSEWFHSPFALRSSEKIADFLDDHLAVKRFEETKIPFVAVTTNLQTGARVPFSSGPMRSVVMASGAVPGAFEPVRAYGTYFVDGGVVDPVPVDVAREMGARLVVAVDYDIGTQLPETSPNHLFGVMQRSLEIAYIRLSQLTSEEADILIDIPFHSEIGTFTDTMNQELYEMGRAETRKVVARIKSRLRQLMY